MTFLARGRKRTGTAIRTRSQHRGAFAMGTSLPLRANNAVGIREPPRAGLPPDQLQGVPDVSLIPVHVRATQVASQEQRAGPPPDQLQGVPEVSPIPVHMRAWSALAVRSALIPGAVTRYRRLDRPPRRPVGSDDHDVTSLLASSR